jgi:triosephosphate isomerase
MKRTPIIAGNWKQNNLEREAIALTQKLMRRTWNLKHAELILFPPFTSLSQLHKLLVSSPIQLGAQDISPYSGGAYTGEISGEMLREFCSHVIIGHSERRSLFGESDSILLEKMRSALHSRLIPVFCVGELLEEREAGKAGMVVSRQLENVLSYLPLSDPGKIILAYEPVWAIGTGQSATPEDAEKMISGVIRPMLERMGGNDFGHGVRILYGGSVKPGNARAFFSRKGIDGALVGGASLEPEDFLEILQRVQAVSSL